MESSKTEFYPHVRPRPNVDYFHRSGKVAAFIAAYNEDAYLLDKTLRTLAKQTFDESTAVTMDTSPNNVNVNPKNATSSGKSTLNEEAETVMDILVVCDGLGKMSDSMKEYICDVWGNSDITNEESWPEDAQVCISSVSGSDTNNFGTIGCLSVLVKRNNHKKTNSHEWHLRSFISGSKYTFMTDCGSLFPDLTLGRLTKYMDEHDDCVGTTGRLRGMTSEQQAPRGGWQTTTTNEVGASAETWGESILRAVQVVGFEEKHVSEWGIGNVAGMLPILHGPCSMFRTTAIEGDAIENYFNMAYQKTSEAGLIQGNLNISEDRVYAICTVFPKGNDDQQQQIKAAASSKTPSDTEKTASDEVTAIESNSKETAIVGSSQRSEYKYTHFCDDSVFLFDLELTGRALVTQRRRWNNGTFAAHLYIIQNCRDLVWRSTNTGISKVICTVLNIFMSFFFLLNYLLAPAMFGSIFYSSWRTILYVFVGGEAGPYFFFHVLSPFNKSEESPKEANMRNKIEAIVGIAVLLAYSIMYGVFLFIHMKRFDSEKDKASVYHAGCWKVVSIFCAVNWVIAFVVGGIILPTIISGPLNGFFLWVVFLILLPKIIALLQDPVSFWLMVKPWNFICNYLSIPVVYNFFFVYAAARFTDLSWGNRPSSWRSTTSDENEEESNSNKERAVKKCCIDGCNISATNSISASAMCEDHEWLRLNVKRAQVLNFCLFLFNLCIMWFFAILNSGLTGPYLFFSVIFLLPLVLMECIVFVDVFVRRLVQCICIAVRFMGNAMCSFG